MTSGEVATQSPRLRAGAAFLLGMGGDGGRTGPAGMEGMMFAKRALALAPLAMLAACATNYPDLVSTRPPPPAVPPQNAELDETLVDAANLQKSYAIGYKQSAQNQDLSALPIIGAAAAAAFVLLANKTNAATTAGNIGIGGVGLVGQQDKRRSRGGASLVFGRQRIEHPAVRERIGVLFPPEPSDRIAALRHFRDPQRFGSPQDRADTPLDSAVDGRDGQESPDLTSR